MGIFVLTWDCRVEYFCMAVPLKNSQDGRFTKGQFASRQFSVRLKHKYDKAFRQLCLERDRIPAELIREIVERWVDEQEAPSNGGE